MPNPLQDFFVPYMFKKRRSDEAASHDLMPEVFGHADIPVPGEKEEGKGEETGHH